MFDNPIDLRHYWHMLLERRWLAITAFLSVLLLAAVYIARAVPIYESTVRLQINRESENVLNIKDVFSFEGREQDYLQTQYKNLQNRTLIQAVAKKLNLAGDPRYATERDMIAAILKDIQIVPIRLSRLVEIKAQHPNPKMAQSMASELAQQFLDANIQQKNKSTKDAFDFLRQEAALQKSNLTRAENDLVKYKTNYNEVSLDDSENVARQALLAAQTDYDRIHSLAMQSAKTVEEIDKRLAGGGKVDDLPEVETNLTIQKLKQEIALQEAELAGLLKRYRDKWPQVIQARNRISSLNDSLNRETEQIVNSIRFEAITFKAKDDALFANLQEKKSEQMQLNQLRIQYQGLKRDLTDSEHLYTTVQNRMKETELTSKILSNNILIADPATEPLRPVKPRKLLTMCLALFGGLGFAIGLAFFVSYLDDSIKSQDDVESYLQLPFLGYIPNIKTNSIVERDLQAHLHPQSNAAEGFRTLRATVALNHNASKFKVLSVTSTIPSEGKSLVASNFAIVTAQTGLKTLLVDADLRRPSVHKAYQLHSPVGLSSYLMKEVTNLDQIVHSTEVPNLDVVCCGAVPASPSELIGSKRMAEFLEDMRNRYDRVFLDCPPISAVSDPLILSAIADGIIFVTKFNKIRREHARKSIQRFHAAGIHVVGAVLNDIDFEGKDSYYYSHYYYQNRYYSSHYKSNGDAPKTDKVIKN